MAKSDRSVDEIIYGLPKPERIIVQHLRNLIVECLPKATEHAYYDWGVPFYRHQRLICFIWPPSMFTGPQHKKIAMMAKGVSLGFCQGNRMSNEDGLLLAEGRKQVYCLYIRSSADINEIQIRALLFEAGLIDESFAKRKKLN